MFNPEKGIFQNTAERVERWATFLRNFTFKIQYRNDQNNGNADALSRHPITEIEEIKTKKFQLKVQEFVKKIIKTQGIDFELIKIMTNQDKTLKMVCECVENKRPLRIMKNIGLNSYKEKWLNLSVINEYLFFGKRLVIPEAAINKVLEILHEDHLGIKKTISIAETSVWWPRMTKDIIKKIEQCA